MDSSLQATIDSKYALLSKLGSGATAEVYLAEDLESHEKVAVKILKTVNKSFQQEVEMLSKIKNENVLTIKKGGEGNLMKNGQCFNSHPYIVLEYAEKGELFDYVYYPKKGFGERFGRFIFKQILNGLNGCHQNGIAHRDLKMENIMLDKDFNIKLADFGFATLLKGKNGDNILTTPLGTLAYAAPEILLKKPYDGVKTDIFSLGVVLFTLVTCKMAFCQASRGDRFYRYVIHKSVDKYWEKLQSQGNNITSLSSEFKDLFIKMISFNPNDRPSIQEVAMHPWMNDPLNEPSALEIKGEFKSREVLVRQQIEIEKLTNENENSAMVYRSLDNKEEYFNKEAKCKQFKGGKGGYKNMMKIKGKFNPIKFMNNYISEIEKEGNKKLELSEKQLKFCLEYSIEEDVEEVEEDIIDKEKLLIEIKLKVIKEHEEYVLQFDKKSGDKFDFCNKVEDLKNLAETLL